MRLSGDGRGARVWYEPAANRIGIDRLLGPEQVYANAAATRQGDLQGAVEKLQAPRVRHRRVPSTANRGPSPCASSWTAPSWRCTAAARRSPTACIPTSLPPAPTCSHRAEWPMPAPSPCGHCAAPGNPGSVLEAIAAVGVAAGSSPCCTPVRPALPRGAGLLQS